MPNKNLSGKRVAILVADDFEQVELTTSAMLVATGKTRPLCAMAIGSLAASQRTFPLSIKP